MKNININTATLSAVSATNAAFKAAEEAYKNAKSELCKAVAAEVEALPAGEAILNIDLAQAAGLHPAHMASILASTGYEMGIRSTTRTVTKRFVEVGEDGKPVEGGEVKEVRRDLCAYEKAPKGRRW